MKKYIKKLLLIASLCLTIAGVIFLTISFFTTQQTIYLSISLCCIVLANLFLVIKNHYSIDDKE